MCPPKQGQCRSPTSQWLEATGWYSKACWKQAARMHVMLTSHLPGGFSRVQPDASSSGRVIHVP
ncbi:MAG: hypothetical protein KJ065_03005 [Anaerolineae bacterium]|nr:hypothetical protein [Anaerolineae bacterium]